jgi:uncharacterized protein (TIGR02646 family)
MIRVKRGRAPQVLTRNRAKWLRELARAKTPAERARILGRYRHEDVKRALVAAFRGKCAYCESRLLHVDYGHIDHFRPKSKYTQQAFDWANLVLACGVCNGREYKGEAFPLQAEGGPLLNPCTEDPARHLSFAYDAEAGLANVCGRTRRGRTTEQRLGLNRKELREYRSRRLTELWCIARFAPTDPEARRLLDEAAEPSSPYSAFAASLRAAMLAATGGRPRP